jgi:hypothetical protein
MVIEKKSGSLQRKPGGGNGQERRATIPPIPQQSPCRSGGAFACGRLACPRRSGSDHQAGRERRVTPEQPAPRPPPKSMHHVSARAGHSAHDLGMRPGRPKRTKRHGSVAGSPTRAFPLLPGSPDGGKECGEGSAMSLLMQEGRRTSGLVVPLRNVVDHPYSRNPKQSSGYQRAVEDGQRVDTPVHP